MCQSILFEQGPVDVGCVLDEIREELPGYVERYPDGKKKPVQHQQDWAIPFQHLLERLGGGVVPSAYRVSYAQIAKHMTLSSQHAIEGIPLLS